MHEAEDIRGLKIALGAYVLVLALKLGAYFITGVMALMAEALHTLSDIFVSGFLLVAAYYSRKAADQVHMFGYGRAQNVAALTAAILFITFTSYKLYEESIPRLFRPGEAAYQNLWLALGVIILSMAIAAVPLVKLYLQKQRGPAAKAQFTESINDELGLLAALVGTLFIVWGKPIADPLASIVVATIIAYNGVRLFLENFSFLLGRSPGPEYLAKMEKLALSVPGVLGVHDLRAEYVGPEIVHAGMHIEVMSGTPIEEADRISHEVEEKIHPGISSGYCFVHVPRPGGGSRLCDLPAWGAWRSRSIEISDRQERSKTMEFKIPHAMKVEHDELHADLTKAIHSGGETGAAAQKVADALHIHFESEEKYALPPLGLLPALAEGKVTPDMAQVFKMTDTLKAELPRMLEEHQAIVAALQKLIEAARQEGKVEPIHFAEKLMLHAKNEEEVSYPTAILIGEYLKLKLNA